MARGHLPIEEFLNSIIVGDAREVLRAIPDESVDMVITSPPYNFGRPYSGCDDSLDWEEYFSFLDDVWKECFRVLKSGGRIAINIQPVFSEYVPTHHIISERLRKIGFLWKAEIIWEKHNYKAKNTAWGSWQSPSMPYIRYSWEFVEVFSKGTQRKDGNRELADISGGEFVRWTYGRWEIAPETRMAEFGHPAMFPEELPYRLMKLYTYRGDIVVDPFNGVGTTTVVAYRLRRYFVGIDISEEYCQTAHQRVKKEASQIPLFDQDENGNLIPFPSFPQPRLVRFSDLLQSSQLPCFERGENI